MNTYKENSERVLVIYYGYAPNEPINRQIAESFAATGAEVTVAYPVSAKGPRFEPDLPSGVEFVGLVKTNYQWLGRLETVGRWLAFKHEVRALVAVYQPTVVVTVQFHALAALKPDSSHGFPFKLACYIWAIPNVPDSGRLDRHINRQAFGKLAMADVVCASDVYMARSAQELGALPALPLVCHVAKPKDHLSRPTWPRDGWLREKLIAEGAPITKENGCVLLRAGAVGPHGAIEETFAAMTAMPTDFVFVLLGRPNEAYHKSLEALLAKHELKRRVFIWPLLPDADWKKCLLGADIGHLIHTGGGDTKRGHDLNSTLSTVRLFNYLAAGLPVVSFDDPRMAGIYHEVDCYRPARLAHLTHDLTEILQSLGNNPQLRQRMGQAARAAFESKYNWETQFAPVYVTILQ